LARLLDPEHVPTRAFWTVVWSSSRRLAVGCFVMAIVLFVGADLAIRLVAPGLSDSSHALAVDSLQIMGPLVSLQLAGSGLAAAQYATQGQALIQASGMLYSASVVPAVLWLTPRIGPVPAAIGTGVSFVLMFVVVSGATLL